MTDLTDFLRARIDEDEQLWGNPAFAPVAGLGLSRLVLKTRAECDAKRRIVDEWLSRSTAGGWFHLACLALPYADHSDYREEWRP